MHREVSLRQKKAEQSNESISKADSNNNPPKAQVVKKKPGLKGIQIKRKQGKAIEPGPSEKPAKRTRLETSS
jgi:archaellum component FlaD/FlaE